MIQSGTASKLVQAGLIVACMLTSACEDRRADKAYLRGDYNKTVKELKYLAEQGELRAQFDLGVLYDKGEGVPQNNHEAMLWYRRAAEQGEARAQYNLGLMYANGQRIPQDVVEAYYWISLAAARGNAHAVEARDYYAGTMTVDQVARAKQMLDQHAQQEKNADTCKICDHLSVQSKPY